MKLTSIKTSGAGLAAIFTILAQCVKALTDGDPNTNIDFAGTFVELSIAWGLLMARDNNVTSEQVAAAKAKGTGVGGSLVSLMPWLFVGLLVFGTSGCVGPAGVIEAAAKDRAKARLEFTGWNAHLVYERDNSFGGCACVTNTAPLLK